MNIDYKHPEFAVWHLAESPVKLIPYGALVKWFDQGSSSAFIWATVLLPGGTV